MKKKALIFNAVVLLLACLGFLHFYVPRFITEIKNPLIELFREKVELQEQKLPKEFKKFTYQTKDGLSISGYFNASGTDTTRGTIVLLHGIRGIKEHFIALSEKLSHVGFQTVAIDLRAHGESEGKDCTFGYFEKEDILQLLDYLQDVEGVKSGIGIWGQSLGGAVALQAMALDDRLEFGIIESTFSDLEIVVNDYSRFHLGFAIRPLSNYLLERSGEIIGYNPSEVKPLKSAGAIRQPVLMVHGGRDQRINIQYGRANFAQLKSLQKEFYEIPEAGHLDIWKKGGDEYFNKVLTFLTGALAK